MPASCCEVLSSCWGPSFQTTTEKRRGSEQREEKLRPHIHSVITSFTCKWTDSNMDLKFTCQPWAVHPQFMDIWCLHPIDTSCRRGAVIHKTVISVTMFVTRNSYQSKIRPNATSLIVSCPITNQPWPMITVSVACRNSWHCLCKQCVYQTRASAGHCSKGQGMDVWTAKLLVHVFCYFPDHVPRAASPLPASVARKCDNCYNC